MSPHTPGPWVAHPGDGWICSASGAEVARIRAACYTDQLEADMNLIAAAPELLAALEDMLKPISAPRDEGHAMNKARAAIAKAKAQP